jgi:hypothetical protein
MVIELYIIQIYVYRNRQIQFFYETCKDEQIREYNNSILKLTCGNPT